MEAISRRFGVLSLRASRFARSASGNFATLTALTAPVALILAAFAIDQGALFIEKRKLQSLVDLAAIAAAADIGDAHTTAAMVLRDNGFRIDGELLQNDLTGPADGSGSGSGLTVTKGRYTPNPSIATGARFMSDGKLPNAVRVSICRAGTRYFSAGFFDAPAIGAKAVAATRDEAAFSVGSRLARLDGGIANALLGALTGSSVSLTTMDYKALLSADFRLRSFLDALNSDLALKAANYNDVLLADVTVGEIAAALAQAEGLSVAAQLAARRLATQTNGNGAAIALGRLLDIGALGLLPLDAASRPGSDPHLGFWDVISSATALAAADGEHHVALDFAANVAGLASAKAALAVGEPPQAASWFSTGGEGSVARTAQTRLLLEVAVGGSGILAGASIRLPIYLEIAHANARLARLACPATPNGTPSVVIAARPGTARLRIGEVDRHALTDFDRSPIVAPARILSTPVARVTARADIEIANRSGTSLRFARDEIANGIVKTAYTTQFADSLSRSLLQGLETDVEIAGLQLVSTRALAEAVAETLGTAAPAIDGVLANTLATLGVRIGEADVRVHAAGCGRAVLVQ